MERARIPSRQEQANLVDYEAARREFTWDQAAELFTWGDTGRLNMAQEAIDRWAQSERGGHPALIFCRGDLCKVFDFRRLRDDSSRLANLLRAMGLEAKNRLAVLLPAEPEIFLAMAACARLGAVCCCLPPHLGREELTALIHRLKPQVVLTSPALAEGLPWEQRSPSQRVIYTSEPPGGLTQEDVVLAQALPAQSPECDIAWVEADHPLFSPSPAAVTAPSGPWCTPMGP